MLTVFHCHCITMTPLIQVFIMRYHILIYIYVHIELYRFRFVYGQLSKVIFSQLTAACVVLREKKTRLTWFISCETHIWIPLLQTILFDSTCDKS